MNIEIGVKPANINERKLPKEEQTMRLFIGINPSDEIRKALVKAQNYLSRHGIAGTYLTPENLHMTLAFIGEYPDEEYVPIRKV